MNSLMNHPQRNEDRNYVILNDIRQIVESGLRQAYQSVNSVTIHTYWKVGKRIVEEEQHGEKRAEYGTQLLEFLAKELSKDFAQGYTARDLRNYRQLYLCFNDLEIWYARVPNLKWTHFRSLLRVTDENARYSILNDRKQIFAAKYLTFMPTEDELRREIEQQKLIFLEQKKSD